MAGHHCDSQNSRIGERWGIERKSNQISADVKEGSFFLAVYRPSYLQYTPTDAESLNMHTPY